tara:strand:- start:1057 stop:2388 length:1332 start_codon:yes stop_codon:yes gene_type:complete
MVERINIPEFEVSEFNQAFKDVIESNFNYVRIKGEISEVKTATKGQIYLTLKDEDSILSGVIWDQKKKYLDINPEVGLEVIATGKITTWSRYKTTYQIDIDRIEIAGEGALLKLIEERKKRLQKKGYFDENKKKALPFLPERLGIITSPTGSVVHDIINRVNDRFPMPLDIWPVSVQGVDAAENIINAVKGFNEMKFDKPDILIIARGGGSTEDLMAFNDENLATSIFDSKIPIISAIGHETDTTIIDLVSDLRASTPTAAAEKATPVRLELIEKIKNLQIRLIAKVNSQIQSKKENYEYLNKFLKSPSSIVNNYKEKLLDDVKNLTLLIENKFNISNLNLFNLGKSVISPDSLISLKQTKINNLSKNLNLNITNNYKDKFEKYKSNIRLLKSNSISANLKKGYAILMDKRKIIKNTKKVAIDDQLSVKLIDGTISIKVKKIN